MITITEAQRLKFTENSLDNFFEFYERPEISEPIVGLFEKFGLSDLVPITFNRENYVAVSPHKGELDVSEIADLGRFPVATLLPNETINIHTQRHPLQSQEVPDGVTEHAASTSPGSAAVASLYAPPIIEDRDGQMILHRGGPLIAFNRLPEIRQLGRTCSSVVLHELTHLAQLLNYQPRSFGTNSTYRLRIAKATLKDELQAYAVQDTMWETVFFEDHSPLLSADAATVINSLRRKAQQDSYEPTRKVIHAFRQESTARKILPQILLKQPK